MRPPDGKAGGEETFLGTVPTKEDLDLTGLEISEDELKAALAVSKEEWTAELPGIDEWLVSSVIKLPAEVREQRDAWQGPGRLKFSAEPHG